VCFSVLHCVALCCTVLHCVALCCTVFQCVAVCCSVLQCVLVVLTVYKNASIARCVAVCCSVFELYTPYTRIRPAPQVDLPCVACFSVCVYPPCKMKTTMCVHTRCKKQQTRVFSPYFLFAVFAACSVFWLSICLVCRNQGAFSCLSCN